MICAQFLHHHFSPRLEFIPPSPFSQSVYSLLSIVPSLSYYSLSVSSSIFSAFCARTPPHAFLRVSSCTSVDISPGHRIPRCLHILTCFDILEFVQTYISKPQTAVRVKRYLAIVSNFSINRAFPSSVSQ